MKIRALAFIAALATPVIASATPNDDKRPKGPASDQPRATTNGDRSKTAKLADDDVRIVAHQHHVNQMEIDMGKYAKQVGTTAAVKKLGDALVTDHTAADKELTAFAKQHGLDVIPVEKPLNEIAQGEMKDTMDAMTRLKTVTGPEFDRQFIAMMITGHDREVGRIEVDIVAARDPGLADMLKKVKPVLQRHADAARELQRGQPTASSTNPRSPRTK